MINHKDRNSRTDWIEGMGIVLFKDKKLCCGCGACANICPIKAITMVSDENGYSYPVINQNLCVSCGACKKVCTYQNGIALHEPMNAYAAVNKRAEQLEKSASGGVFAAIATYFLERGGVVFGASLDFENGHPMPHMIGIEDISQLKRIQGSKYVQSAVEETYKEAKYKLDEGKKVLFSGTPCQIAGLYGYLKKEYNNLWTIDVICHGVPNAEFFDSYLSVEAKKRGGVPVGYSFRDKKRGWDIKNARLDLKQQDGSIKHFYIPARTVSYTTLFYDCDIFRENCYVCPYACKERVADITLGDFWGIEREHPEILKQDEFDEKKGISCILVNTQKGVELCENLSDKIYLRKSSYDKIARKNGQLIHPSFQSKQRKNIMELYQKAGYDGVEQWFCKHYRKQIMIHSIYNMIPRKLRIALKSMVKK